MMLEGGGTSAVRKIGWLVEPDDPPYHLTTLRMVRAMGCLRGIVAQESCEIEPIQVRIQGGFSRWLSKWMPPVEPRPEELSRSVSEALGFRYRVLPLRVFNWHKEPDENLAHYLSCYAELSHLDLLVAPSGLNRKLLRSFRHNFTSVLGLLSEVPVLVIDEDGQRYKRVRNILFPVIKPARCELGFKNTLKLAQLSGARITILLRILDNPGADFWGPPIDQFGSIPFYEPDTMIDANSRLRALSDWLRIARREGVEAEIRLDQTSGGFFLGVLACQGDEKCDLLAIDPDYFESGYFGDALLRLVKEAACPVWSARPLGQSSIKGSLHLLERQLS